MAERLNAAAMARLPAAQREQLIEETDTYVTVRLEGHMHNTGVGGGLAFGIHRSNKNLVHTLSPAG